MSSLDAFSILKKWLMASQVVIGSSFDEISMHFHEARFTVASVDSSLLTLARIEPVEVLSFDLSGAELSSRKVGELLAVTIKFQDGKFLTLREES